MLKGMMVADAPCLPPGALSGYCPTSAPPAALHRPHTGQHRPGSPAGTPQPRGDTAAPRGPFPSPRVPQEPPGPRRHRRFPLTAPLTAGLSSRAPSGDRGRSAIADRCARIGWPGLRARGAGAAERRHFAGRGEGGRSFLFLFFSLCFFFFFIFFFVPPSFPASFSHFPVSFSLSVSLYRPLFERGGGRAGCEGVLELGSSPPFFSLFSSFSPFSCPLSVLSPLLFSFPGAPEPVSEGRAASAMANVSE